MNLIQNSIVNYFNYKFRYNFFSNILREDSLIGNLNLDGFGPP